MSDTNTETLPPENTPDPAPIEPVDAPVDPSPEPIEPVEVLDHGNKGKQPWFLKRIAEESARARAAEELAAKNGREAAEARALAERLQTTQQPESRPAPRPAPGEADFDTAVQTEAARRLFFQATADVKDAGIKEFGSSFNESLNILTAVGATNDDVVSDILAVDKSGAHKLLDMLAKDPEQAANLVGMDSKRRIAELTRLSMNAVAKIEPKVDPKPKQVSKAPPPAPPVEPNTRQVTDWRSDKASDQEFDAGFDEMMKRRNARR